MGTAVLFSGIDDALRIQWLRFRSTIRPPAQRGGERRRRAKERAGKARRRAQGLPTHIKLRQLPLLTTKRLNYHRYSREKQELGISASPLPTSAAPLPAGPSVNLKTSASSHPGSARDLRYTSGNRLQYPRSRSLPMPADLPRSAAESAGTAQGRVTVQRGG